MVEVHAILAALRSRDEEAAWSSCTMHVRRSAMAALAGLERVEAAGAAARLAVGGGAAG
jgi:DNA-binding GntR family transcriptional regulator